MRCRAGALLALSRFKARGKVSSGARIPAKASSPPVSEHKNRVKVNNGRELVEGYARESER